MSRSKIMDRLQSDVQTFGWQCLSVHPRLGEAGAHFTYSIGLEETFKHPEIMIFGLSNKVSHGVLSDCVQMIRSGFTFHTDVEYPDVIGSGYKIIFKVARFACLREYFGAAVRFYDDKPFRALVLFWPDKNHMFPWQESTSTAQREALDIVQP